MSIAAPPKWSTSWPFHEDRGTRLREPATIEVDGNACLEQSRLAAAFPHTAIALAAAAELLYSPTSATPVESRPDDADPGVIRLRTAEVIAGQTIVVNAHSLSGRQDAYERKI
jgi:hypothetical protein